MKLLALMKKEFKRFFGDVRLVVTMLLPGVLIYVIYSLMGLAIHAAQKYDYTVLLSSEGAQATSAWTIIEQAIAINEDVTLKVEIEGDSERAKESVKKGDKTAYVEIAADFDGKMAANEKPAVCIYYSMENEASLSFFSLASEVLGAYQDAFAPFTVNAGEEQFDLSGGKDSFLQTMMGGILPMLLIVLLFSSCMSVAIESVAGEKERGTLATILVTSAKRSHIALGKILPLSCISAIGAASSFFGVALSMPKLMGASVSSMVGGYGFLSYFMLFLLIVGIVPLVVSLIAAVSTYARSVKEASAYTSILMILTMVISLVSAFVSGIGNWAVAVPLMNAVVAMQGILSRTVAIWVPFVAFAANLVYTAGLVLLVTKMLSSERIMFGTK